jgi:hypothetical protein
MTTFVELTCYLFTAKFAEVFAKNSEFGLFYLREALLYLCGKNTAVSDDFARCKFTEKSAVKKWNFQQFMSIAPNETSPIPYF